MCGRRGMKKAASSLIKGRIHGRGEVSPGSGPTVPVFGSSPAAERLAGRHDGELSSEGAPPTRQEPARKYPPPGGLLSQFWFVGYLLLVAVTTYLTVWLAWYWLFRGAK